MDLDDHNGALGLRGASRGGEAAEAARTATVPATTPPGTAASAALAPTASAPAAGALERFFELSADLLIVCELDGTLRHVNPAWERVLGHAPETVVGRNLLEFVVAEDRQATHAALCSAIERGGVDGFENRYRRADGAERIIQWTARVDREEGAVYGVGRDVTLHRRVESELAESRAVYQAVVDASLDGILVTSPDGRIHLANPAMRAMLRYPEGAAGPAHRDEVVDRGDPRLPKALAQRAATGRFFGELTLKRADGSRFPAELSTVVFRDSEGRERTSMVVRDVSEREGLRTALRDAGKREQLQGAAIDASANAIVITDPDGIIQWVNPAFTGMTGYSAEEAIGRKTSLLASGRQPAGFYADLWRTISGGVPWHGELVNRRKDGSLYTQEQTITPVLDEDGRITQFVSVMQDVTPRAQARARIQALNERLRAQLGHMRGIHRVDTAILQEGALGGALNVVLDEAAGELGVDAATLYRADVDAGSLRPLLERAMPKPAPTLRFREGIAGEAAASRAPVLLRDVDEPDRRDVSRMREYGFGGLLALPLISMGRLEGVLALFSYGPMDLDENDVAFAEGLAHQAALAIQRDTLVAGLEHARDELQEAYDRTIEGWARALDLKDEETAGHSQRVTELSLALARRLGVPEAELAHVRRGALLHDMGKMGVPDAILLKPGRLTAEEFEAIKRHPGYAYDMLKDIAFLRPALAIPRYHHERWDGSGYPDGLAGEAIPLAARIFAVVDVYDALTNARPYRPAWSREEALAHIRAGAGSHFDPRVAEAFVDLIASREVPRA